MRRLLLYAYTHVVEDLEWEDTLKLYEAACKYAVLPLKEICSSRLKDFASPANVSLYFVLQPITETRTWRTLYGAVGFS
ncbi:hypothetical protein TNIN_19631 [Trichonephila inaurata madagascariensis]|uniref:BTB domain-containing protein n=1 Tax=Trichonephila inaurata madagascariensis TaxID=2747483 RepID=A0A8X6XQK0_9ARAC|nr:hypothetical protein TNIN_19631 [Trichonephila inaurata madagascariensis]